MKRTTAIILTMCIMAAFVTAGCGAQKAGSSTAAIDYSKTLATVQEKTTYLVGQAKSFYNSKDFQGSVDIAQYVLRYLDKDSAAAKSLLQKAQEGLTAQLKQKAEEVKKGFAGFGQ
ncbi:MAG: hypothetical protein P9L88_01175 [Candidatus Tantalella remota]|nr:hypothetical protein [Candidatus Tantalella remota]